LKRASDDTGADVESAQQHVEFQQQPDSAKDGDALKIWIRQRR